MSGGSDGALKLWHANDGHLAAQVTDAHRRAIEDLKVVQQYAFSSSSDGTVKLWLVKNNSIVHQLTITDHLTSVYRMHVRQTDEQDLVELYTASADCTVRRFNVNLRTQVIKADFVWHHQDWMKCVAVHEQWVACGGRDGLVRVYDQDQ